MVRRDGGLVGHLKDLPPQHRLRRGCAKAFTFNFFNTLHGNLSEDVDFPFLQRTLRVLPQGSLERSEAGGEFNRRAGVVRLGATIVGIECGRAAVFRGDVPLA